MPKKPYQPPRVVEHGRIDQITAGSGGGRPDAIIIGGSPQADAYNPSCVHNDTSGYCYRL